jgi:hypothetical protein
MNQNLLVTLFSLVMLANVVVLVRHWQMMRMIQFILTNLIESQKQFNEIMEAEQRRKR